GNEGIVIDLSQMKGMRVDPVARTIQTEPGLTWGELNHDLQVFELGASGGFVSITGIPGLTLGGGFGWVVRKHGLAMDNLLSVDIVTADGRFLTASSSQNSDLFWGVRGGGGNFGAHRDLTYNFLVTSEWADRADSGETFAGRANSGKRCSRFWQRQSTSTTPATKAMT